MPKRLPEPYRPTTPPNDFKDWPRWITDELWRLTAAIESNPVMIDITGSGTINIDDVPNTVVLGIGDDPLFDYPGGAWDSATGTFTASLSGIYNIACQATIQAFGSGNKSYYGQLQCNVNGAPRVSNFDGGADDVPLGLSLSSNIILVVGDSVTMEISAVHEQFTGVSDYDYRLGYQRSAA